MKKPAIIALAIAATITWIAPAQAFPVMNAPTVATQSDAAQPNVTQVDWHGHRGHIWRRGGGGYSSDRFSGHRNGMGGGYYRHGGYYGHRGYYGYRHHGGDAAAIIGGLAAGAIIGGALAERPRHYYGSHASYCASRYRTYRASDNTYQPTNGPRRQCR